MPKRHTVRSSLFLLPFLALAACSAPRVDLMPHVGRMEFGGTVAADTSGLTLTSNNVRDDLGLTENSNELGGRADLSFGGSVVTLSYSPASFSGNGTLSGQLTRDGVTLPVGTNVASKIQLDVGSLIWTHDLIPGDTVELGLGLGAHVIDFQSTLTSTDVGTPGTIDLDETLPVPVVAVRAGLEFGAFDVSALGSGIKANYNGDDATFYDVDLMGRWRFIGGSDGHLSGAVFVGWRKTAVELDYTDGSDHTQADIHVAGFYYGLGLGF